MHITKDHLEWVTIVATGFAAVFWLVSACVRVPALLESPLKGPQSITDRMQRMSMWSAIAAVCAAVAAGAQLWSKLAFPLLVDHYSGLRLILDELPQ